MKIALRRWLELLGSMRLAITLLLAIALASIIGTLIQQGEPYANYQIQFGLFWFRQFAFLGLYDIYHTGWFIGLLGALLASTSLCVYRYTPSMLRAMRHWRPAEAASVLKKMPYVTSWPIQANKATLTIEQFTREWGRFAQRKQPQPHITILRWGSGYRWGYILTHVGIIFICLGGMLDSNLSFKWQQWRGAIVPETRELHPDAIPPQSRLQSDNPAFRVQVNIPEGSQTNYAFLNTEEGYLLQELPFQLKLDRFHVEYHTTGQPKAFISDITVTTPEGKTFQQAVEVNKPFILGSIAVYQASFGDGGTRFNVRPIPLFGETIPTFPEAVQVFGKYPLTNGYTLEVDDFKPINVESNPNNQSKEQKESWQSFFSAIPKEQGTQMMNLGPAWVYRYRDKQGQAREYRNYLQPVFLEGRWYMMSGIREALDQQYRYLRFPLTPQGYLEPYFLWRAYFLDAERWPAGAETFVKRLPPQMTSHFSEDVIKKMAQSVLSLFAQGGYEHVAEYLEKQVPKKEQTRIAELYLKILDQLSLDSYSAFYAEHKALQAKMPVPGSAEAVGFIRETVLSISDSFLYGSPFYLQVVKMEPMQSSGFQIGRSPGQPVVYGGCLLLVIGTFLLFYWRETRVWMWCEADQLYFAMNSNRLDSLTLQKFERYRNWVELTLHDKKESVT